MRFSIYVALITSMFLTSYSEASSRTIMNSCHVFYSRNLNTSGFQIGDFPESVAEPLTKDYRLYLYPEKVLTNFGANRLRATDIHLLTEKTKIKLKYLVSIHEPTHLEEVAFFQNSLGTIFGVRHTELFNGHFELSDQTRSIKILDEISKIIEDKLTNPKLNKMFEKEGFGLWRFNTRYKFSEKILSSVPLVSRSNDHLFYALKPFGNQILSVRNFISNKMKIEITEVIKNDGKTPNGNQSGNEIQKRIIDEILDFVFPLYGERRGWSAEFIETLRAKAHATAVSTKYIVVRDPQTNQILATMGLSRAPYGKAILRDSVDWRWKEIIGLFGSSIYKDGLGPKVPKWNSFSSQAPLLPMEGYLEGLRLPRPAVTELIARNFWDQKDVFGSPPLGPGDIKSSAFDPLFSGSGIIYEPTKFAVAKNLASMRISHDLVIKELFAAVFDLRYQHEFLNEGQYLYTYNDRKGIRLYEGMGFHLMDEKSITKDGTDWYLLGLSPERMLQVVESKTFGTDEASKLFSNQLQERIINLLEIGQSN